MSSSCSSCPYTKGKEEKNESYGFGSLWNMIGGADGGADDNAVTAAKTDATTTSNNDDLEKLGETAASAATAALIGSIIFLITWVASFAVFVYAIYLSFKCNKGFNFGGFLAAFCCSPCYVIYSAVNKCL
ncbi:MAG: hypothetical protein WD512_13410 [Candidatus Paceibacterota bacterium]